MAIVKIEWQAIVNELNDWKDIIGEDIVEAILYNLEEVIEDQEESV